MADHFVAASGPRVSVKITTGVGGMPPVWFVAIAARNSGPLGTEVQQFGLQPPNGRHVQNIYDFLGQPVQLLMPLGPGGTATMTYPAEDIRRLLHEQGISGENVRPYVNTGHGRFEGEPIHLGKRIAKPLTAPAKGGADSSANRDGRDLRKLRRAYVVQRFHLASKISSELRKQLCPRQDSNLRHRLLQPDVFDGSRLLSPAVVGQRFSASLLCHRLSLILADFRS